LALKKILYIDFVSYVCIIISYVHFSELQIRQAFSCPRTILILNLEALVFCFDKHESDLNFNMHVHVKIWFNTQIPLMSYWQTWYFPTKFKLFIDIKSSEWIIIKNNTKLTLTQPEMLATRLGGSWTHYLCLDSKLISKLELTIFFTSETYQGRIQEGGGAGTRPPLKLEKIWFFWHTIDFSHEIPQHFL
jgi:hypothetical protein